MGCRPRWAASPPLYWGPLPGKKRLESTGAAVREEVPQGRPWLWGGSSFCLSSLSLSLPRLPAVTRIHLFLSLPQIAELRFPANAQLPRQRQGETGGHAELRAAHGHVHEEERALQGSGWWAARSVPPWRSRPRLSPLTHPRFCAEQSRSQRHSRVDGAGDPAAPGGSGPGGGVSCGRGAARVPAALGSGEGVILPVSLLPAPGPAPGRD